MTHPALPDRLRCRYDGRDFSGPAPSGMVLPSAIMLEAAARIDALEKIILTASATRDAQRHYFADRTNDNLRRSKALETQLDKMLAEHAAELAGVRQEKIEGMG